jgi:hypothetical protein
VFLGRKNKPRERFYLLPGQGGKNYHRKQRQILGWSIVLSLIFGAALAVILWLLSQPKP